MTDSSFLTPRFEMMVGKSCKQPILKNLKDKNKPIWAPKEKNVKTMWLPCV